MERLVPQTEAEVAAIVAEGRPMEIIGRGTRRRMGAAVRAERLLDLSALNGVVVYEPNELILSVKAATPMADVHALLAAEGQHLAFEPPDFGMLWGEAAGQGTIGGALSIGLGGPRRPWSGAPRDHLLGFKAINGTGEAFAAGGRVVKNVTGFDLPKVMAGAQGTLGVLTEVTLKVLPAPPAVRTLCFHGLGEGEALALLRDASASPVSVTGAAHLPADVAGRLNLSGPATVLRVESLAPIVDLAVDRLRHGFPDAAAHATVLDHAASDALWRRIGGAAVFADMDGDVWRISVPRAAAPTAGEALRRSGVSSLYYDWAGGLIWALGPLGWRPALQDASARLVRGATPSPLQSSSPGVDALSQRLKQQFDPLGLFNPGRLREVA